MFESLSLARKSRGLVRNLASVKGYHMVRVLTIGETGKAYHIKDIVRGRFYYPRDPGKTLAQVDSVLS